jgi:hypothetical protein
MHISYDELSEGRQHHESWHRKNVAVLGSLGMMYEVAEAGSGVLRGEASNGAAVTRERLSMLAATLAGPVARKASFNSWTLETPAPLAYTSSVRTSASSRRMRKGNDMATIVRLCSCSWRQVPLGALVRLDDQYPESKRMVLLPFSGGRVTFVCVRLRVNIRRAMPRDTWHRLTRAMLHRRASSSACMGNTACASRYLPYLRKVIVSKNTASVDQLEVVMTAAAGA